MTFIAFSQSICYNVAIISDSYITYMEQPKFERSKESTFGYEQRVNTLHLSQEEKDALKTLPAPIAKGLVDKMADFYDWGGEVLSLPTNIEIQKRIVEGVKKNFDEHLKDNKDAQYIMEHDRLPFLAEGSEKIYNELREAGVKELDHFVLLENTAELYRISVMIYDELIKPIKNQNEDLIERLRENLTKQMKAVTSLLRQ